MQIAQSFDADAVALYDRDTQEFFRAGPRDFPDADGRLRQAALEGTLFRDAADRTVVTSVRLGAQPIGSLGISGVTLSDSALQGLSNLVAIGLERSRAQEAASRAEAARQSDELKSTLLDALAQTAVDRQAVLLVAYDTEYPPPLHAKRPIPDAFGVAMVLTPERSSTSMASIDLVLTDENADLMPDAELESLRRAIPAARSLPLLHLLAMRAPGRAILDYLDVSRAAVQVQPCY